MEFIDYYSRDIGYYLLQSSNLKMSTDVISLADDTVNYFRNKYLTPDDILLLNMISKNSISQPEFNDFIEKWDIESKGGQKALMLSYLMKKHPELNYPSYIGPRLKGLLQFYRFRNVKLEAEFKKICTVLKDKNIEIMIIKGGAMKHLYPELPRVMGDIDIIVHKNDFNIVKNIVRDLGYNYEDYGHSIDLHKGNSQEGILDIHNRINMLSKDEHKVNDDLFKRAHAETVFGVEGVLVPSAEDLVFLSIINLSKNLAQNTSIHSLFHSYLDCKNLVDSNPDFNWDIVKSNIVKSSTELPFYIVSKLINSISTSFIPILSEKGYKKSGFTCLYNRYYLLKLKEKSHRLSFKDVCSGKTGIVDYLSFRIMYFIYKREFLRRSPSFSEFMLTKRSNNICKH